MNFQHRKPQKEQRERERETQKDGYENQQVGDWIDREG